MSTTTRAEMAWKHLDLAQRIAHSPGIPRLFYLVVFLALKDGAQRIKLLRKADFDTQLKFWVQGKENEMLPLPSHFFEEIVYFLTRPEGWFSRLQHWWQRRKKGDFPKEETGVFQFPKKWELPLEIPFRIKKREEEIEIDLTLNFENLAEEAKNVCDCFCHIREFDCIAE